VPLRLLKNLPAYGGLSASGGQVETLNLLCLPHSSIYYLGRFVGFL
jgi:hypothetical protein